MAFVVILILLNQVSTNDQVWNCIALAVKETFFLFFNEVSPPPPPLFFSFSFFHWAASGIYQNRGDNVVL